jgi:uncharacterized GH25 family protein
MKIAGMALFVCAALAQTAQTPSEPKPAVVAGKVVNSVTGELVRKAELTLTSSLMPEGFEVMAAQLGLDAGAMAGEPAAKGPKKTFTATTDSGGKFKFERVDPGDYYLTVKHAGFMDETYKPTGKDSVEGRLHLSAGRELSEVEFRLVPQGAVSGRVVDEDGDPVPNAMATASKFSFATGHRKLQPADNGMTNDRGEFRLGKLPAGSYYLSAEMIGIDAMGSVPPAPKDGSPETGYVGTYFPGTTDIQQAQAVEVKPAGDVGGFVIHLQKSRVVRVKGTLAGPDGKPLKSAQIMLMSGARPGSMRMSMVNDPEGKFEIANVAPGAYLAMTMQMTGASPTMTMQPLFVPNENMTDVKLGVAAEGSLQGRLVVSGDGKVVLKGIGIMLAGDEDAPVMPSMGTVTESGAFTLTKVASAPHVFSVSRLPAGAYLKSVLWNGRDILGQSLDLSAGTGGDLQVILGTDGGSIDAAVSHDDKPVSDATVVLLPEDPTRRYTETTHSQSTDEKGHAAFKDVPPGNYLLFAWEKVEQGAWFDPAFLKAAASEATKVTIGPKDSQHVEVKLIPASK